MSNTRRLRLFDALRGFSVISMVLFHMTYDLVFLRGMQLPFFEPPYRDVWRASISWTFLLIAGIMCSFSRDNFRRSLKYGAVAFAIFLATTVAAVDTPINFGIIFCMAGSTFVAALLQKAGVFGRHDRVKVVVFVILFLLTLNLHSGWVGIGGLRIAVPTQLYSTPWFSWLGLPGPMFASGDYYPLVPYSLLYLAGAHFASYVQSHGGFPQWCQDVGCKPLELVGSYALPIYVLHQPLILLALGLV